MACLLRSLSRRSLSTKWFCSQVSRPVLLRHIKDENEPKFSSSSLLIRRFHKEGVFFEERSRMSFVRPVGCGGLLCRHMSSSSSSESEDLCIKVDAFGNVAEELAPEKTLEAMATKVSVPEECTAAIGNFSFPEDCVQYVINGIHELTGFNWWMSIVLTAFLVNVFMSPIYMRYQKQARELVNLGRSIQQLERRIKACDPKSLPKYKKWEKELEKALGDGLMSSLNIIVLDASVYFSFIHGISVMAKKIPELENGGILWFTDLSTPESFYILPLVAGFTFWFTAEININRSNLSSKMKRLPVFLATFIAIQAAFDYQPAVYFYVIPSRIYVYTLVLMLSTKQMVKLRSILGWADVPVRKVPEKQEMIMGRVIRLMSEFINVLKKKDKKM